MNMIKIATLETRRRLEHVTGDAQVSYWPIYSLSLKIVPEVFAEVNSTQFLSRF